MIDLWRRNGVVLLLHVDECRRIVELEILHGDEEMVGLGSEGKMGLLVVKILDN